MNDIRIKKIENNLINVALNAEQRLIISKNLMSNFCLEGYLDFTSKENDWLIYSNNKSFMYFGSISFDDKKIYVQSKGNKNDFLTVISPKYCFIRVIPTQKIKVILPLEKFELDKGSCCVSSFINYKKDTSLIYEISFDWNLNQEMTTICFYSKLEQYCLNVVFEKKTYYDVCNLNLPLFRDVVINEVPWDFTQSSQWNWLRYDREKNNQ